MTDRITSDMINDMMNASLDYISREIDERQWRLGDLPETPTWRFNEQYILDFFDEMIDDADRFGVAPIINDFRDFWFSDHVQESLRRMLMRNTSERLSAVWVRDTLNMDPVRNAVVRSIWYHLGKRYIKDGSY